MINNSIMQTNIAHLLLCQIFSSCCSSSAVLSARPLDFLSFRSSPEHTSKNWMLIMAPNALASLRLLFWTLMPLSRFKSPREQYLGIQRWISWSSKHWSEKGVSKGGTRIIERAVLIMSALAVRLRALRVFANCGQVSGFHARHSLAAGHIACLSEIGKSRGVELFWSDPSERFQYFWRINIWGEKGLSAAYCQDVRWIQNSTKQIKQTYKLVSNCKSCFWPTWHIWFILRHKLRN